MFSISTKHSSCIAKKAFHYSALNKIPPVPLSFTKFDTYKKHKTKLPGVIEKEQPLIICHGLFGSKQNWKSLAKTISVKSQCEVYTIDARNHGESPHVEEHTYESMAQDVLHFIKERGIEKPMLMGHSMGGKVMMHLALLHPDLVQKLIVIDMPPLKITLGDEFDIHIRAMRKINAMQLKKQKEADAILSQYEPDVVVRQFLLTNLKKNLSKDGIYEFRIPYDTLGRSIQHMGDFKLLLQSQRFDGSTLFITGDLSPYRKQFVDQPELIKAQFPNSRIENIQGAGHWVQAEKPDEFISISTKFINEEE